MISINFNSNSQNLPSGIVMKDILGGTFTMGDNSIYNARKNITAKEHDVSLSNYQISETEITTAQFTEFLNSAYADGFLEIVVGMRATEVVGTASSAYVGKALYELTGTRVMKDHDDADGDCVGLGCGDGAFTGTVEPENPLNIAFIGFDANLSAPFFVKDPSSDFNWYDVCDYYNYTAIPRELDLSQVQNDYNDWPELQNLPTLADVSEYPVAYVRWWGAKAFALYYNDINLPTEAQWEYAAKGGQNFFYGVYDGADVANANWNQTAAAPATHHRHYVKEGLANPYGLYNMAGNVWEWVEDNYEPYDTTIVLVVDPLILNGGTDNRCKRGGSWNYHQATLETAQRDYTFDNRGNDHHGFRIAGISTITSSNITETACNSYTVPSGDETYTTSGVYFDTIPNAAGSDSIIIINLTVNYNQISTVEVDLCSGSSYIYADGTVHPNITVAESHTSTLTGQAVSGCDSIVTENVSVLIVDVSVTENGITLSANIMGANYQWIDCNDNNNSILGETNQSFIATVNGSYAVIITDGNCVDTSICYAVTGVRIKELNNTSISIYPNPTNGNIIIEGENIKSIKITDVNGRLIKQLTVTDKQIDIDLSKEAKGIYFVNICTVKEIIIKKIVVE